MNKTLLAGLALLTLLPAHAGVGVTSASFTYSQDFNSLSTTGWVNDSTLTGWSLFRTTGTVSLVIGTGSSNAGGLYSFGARGGGDRALGSGASGSTGTNLSPTRLAARSLASRRATTANSGAMAATPQRTS